MGTHVKVIQGTYGIGFVTDNEELLAEETINACREIDAGTTAASSSEGMPEAQPEHPGAMRDATGAPGGDGGGHWGKKRGWWYMLSHTLRQHCAHRDRPTHHFASCRIGEAKDPGPGNGSNDSGGTSRRRTLSDPGSDSRGSSRGENPGNPSSFRAVAARSLPSTTISAMSGRPRISS
jgi:hypothetical protein